MRLFLISLLLAVLPTSVAAEPAVEVEVLGGMYAFVPDQIEIPVGTTVRWLSRSGRHTVTSSDGGPLDSGFLGPDEVYEFTFTTAGTYPYVCFYHEAMGQTGVVTVKE